MGEKMRIYIGGLGSCVREDDLKKTFGSPHLGTVEAVEINRNKGRSFGYMEFVPASEKALAKLFSTYNGCMWKGGKLRLEKAKEHYLSRLGREWTEAELAAKLVMPKVDAVECVPSLHKFKEDRDVETHIRIFFPKLRKIKPLPFKGSGKHKYSFQRVSVPPLPVHFCDCEEHSAPSESAQINYTNEPDRETSGVDEEELNIMKSVLGKLLEKGNHSNTSLKQNESSKEIMLPSTPADNFQIGDITEDQVSDDEDDDDVVINVARPSKKENHSNTSLKHNESSKERKLPLTPADNFQIGGITEDQVSEADDDDDDDDDDVVINVARSSKQPDMFEHWGQFKSAANQGSLYKDVELSERNEKSKPMPDKKRKASSNENDTDNTVASKKKARKEISDAPISKKSAWKNVVNEKGSTAFHISDILSSSNTKLEAMPKSAVPSSAKKDSQKEQSNKSKELEKLSYVQSSEPRASDVGDEEMEDKMDDGAKEGDQTNNIKKVEMVSDIQCSEVSKDTVVNKEVEEKIAVVDSKDDQTEKNTEMEMASEVQCSKSSVVEDDKSGRGAAWRKKSSWMQLIGDSDKGSFSIRHILPGVTFEKQEIQSIDFSTLNRNDKQLKEEANKEGFVKEQNHDGDKLNSHVTEQKVEEINEARRNSISSYRASAGQIVISETCPFMANAESKKLWTKMKASLSASLKKKGQAKHTNMD